MNCVSSRLDRPTQGSTLEGYIDVVSEVGKGITFTIYLPVWRERGPTDRERLGGIAEGHGEMILLVEDEPMVLQATAAALEQLGYGVLTATDGQQGLHPYEQHCQEIAVALIDMVLSGMHGLALLQALRARSPAVKIGEYPAYSQKKRRNLEQLDHC